MKGIPIWKKAILTLEEAVYIDVGINCLRRILDEDDVSLAL